jgi:hypothetical protein
MASGIELGNPDGVSTFSHHLTIKGYYCANRQIALSLSKQSQFDRSMHE